MISQRDSHILQRIADGDDSAFGEWYLQMGRPLYAFIFRYLKSAQEAEEILQETLLKVVQGRKNFPTGLSLRAWMYTVAHHLALNRLRARKQAREKESQLTAHIEIENCDNAEVNPLHREWVDQEVKKLPPIFGKVYELRTAGKSYQEMSSYLGIPVGTVKSRLHEVTKTLKRRWKLWNVN